MPKAKIQRASQKGKAWQITVKNPKTGKSKTISGGQKGAKVKPGTPKAKAFMARHGKPTTAKQYVNKRIWQGKKVGDIITIPSKYF